MEIHRQTKPGVSYFQPAVKTRPKDIPVYLALPGTERERESFVLEECNEEDPACEESSARMKLVIENFQSWKGKIFEGKCCSPLSFLLENFYTLFRPSFGPL